MKMAKVFTMKTWINRDGAQMIIVTTVDSKATLDDAVRNVGLTMLNIAGSEVTADMPLPLALDFARRQREKMGITTVIHFRAA